LPTNHNQNTIIAQFPARQGFAQSMLRDARGHERQFEEARAALPRHATTTAGGGGGAPEMVVDVG
jgi:hypothetical protein